MSAREAVRRPSRNPYYCGAKMSDVATVRQLDVGARATRRRCWRVHWSPLPVVAQEDCIFSEHWDDIGWLRFDPRDDHDLDLLGLDGDIKILRNQPSDAPLATSPITTTVPSYDPNRREKAMPNVGLCVGINTYPDPITDLRGCVHDANAWRLLLNRRRFRTDRLLDSHATTTAILSGLTSLA